MSLNFKVKINTFVIIVMQKEFWPINFLTKNVKKVVFNGECLIKIVFMKTGYLRNSFVTLNQHE